MWDLHTGARRQKMEGHQKGVLSLTYNDDFKLLLSAGFEHDALVWSPFSPTAIFKLRGHKNSLIGIDSIGCSDTSYSAINVQPITYKRDIFILGSPR